MLQTDYVTPSDMRVRAARPTRGGYRSDWVHSVDAITNFGQVFLLAAHGQPRDPRCPASCNCHHRQPKSSLSLVGTGFA